MRLYQVFAHTGLSEANCLEGGDVLYNLFCEYRTKQGYGRFNRHITYSQITYNSLEKAIKDNNGVWAGLAISEIFLTCDTIASGITRSNIIECMEINNVLFYQKDIDGKYQFRGTKVLKEIPLPK